MTNAADISYTANIKNVFTDTLNRMTKGSYFGRETVNGLKMAIAFLNDITTEKLTEVELRHAVRLANYRGLATDYRVLTTR